MYSLVGNEEIYARDPISERNREARGASLVAYSLSSVICGFKVSSMVLMTKFFDFMSLIVPLILN